MLYMIICPYYALHYRYNIIYLQIYTITTILGYANQTSWGAIELAEIIPIEPEQGNVARELGLFTMTVNEPQYRCVQTLLILGLFLLPKLQRFDNILFLRRFAIIMQTVNESKVKWSLRDVIFLAIIAIFFGVIFELWSAAYYAVAATPLKPYANDLTLGVWLMAGPLAGAILQKVGSSTIGEVLAAAVEMLLFSSWGAANLISGFVQGIGTELGFAATGYKSWDKLGLTLSVLTTTIVTFIWDLFNSGYADYKPGMMITLFIIRLISAGFFGGVLVYYIKKLVTKSGLLKR